MSCPFLVVLKEGRPQRSTRAVQRKRDFLAKRPRMANTNNVAGGERTAPHGRLAPY